MTEVDSRMEIFPQCSCSYDACAQPLCVLPTTSNDDECAQSMCILPTTSNDITRWQNCGEEYSRAYPRGVCDVESANRYRRSRLRRRNHGHYVDDLTAIISVSVRAKFLCTTKVLRDQCNRHRNFIAARNWFREEPYFTSRSAVVFIFLCIMCSFHCSTGYVIDVGAGPEMVRLSVLARGFGLTALKQDGSWKRRRCRSRKQESLETKEATSAVCALYGYVEGGDGGGGGGCYRRRRSLPFVWNSTCPRIFEDVVSEQVKSKSLRETNGSVEDVDYDEKDKHGDKDFHCNGQVKTGAASHLSNDLMLGKIGDTAVNPYADDDSHRSGRLDLEIMNNKRRSTLFAGKSRVVPVSSKPTAMSSLYAMDKKNVKHRISPSVKHEPRSSPSSSRCSGLVTNSGGTLQSRFGDRAGGWLSPLDRILLTANGNLQRIFSSYYDAPVTVSVDSCNMRCIRSRRTKRSFDTARRGDETTGVVERDQRWQDDDDGNNDNSDEPNVEVDVVWDRCVHLTVHAQRFCTATSVITVRDKECIRLVNGGEVGLGQLFRFLDKLPAFELLDVGRDDRGALWREYELECDELTCLIVEEFEPNVWDILPRPTLNQMGEHDNAF